MRSDEISREAWRREASHGPGDRNFRPHVRPKGANLMGLRGEEAFANRYGLAIDLNARRSGDGGRDFHLPLLIDGRLERFSVYCKAALRPPSFSTSRRL
jgi:hypothetical protein